MDFNEFWNKAPVAAEFCNRYYATRDVWDKRSRAAQKAILADLSKMAGKNPYFFVLDYPEPKPEFLKGDEGGDLVQVLYDGKYKICTRETMNEFNLKFIKDW